MRGEIHVVDTDTDDTLAVWRMAHLPESGDQVIIEDETYNVVGRAFAADEVRTDDEEAPSHHPHVEIRVSA